MGCLLFVCIKKNWTAGVSSALFYISSAMISAAVNGAGRPHSACRTAGTVFFNNLGKHG